MKPLLDPVRMAARTGVRGIARPLNRLTGGRLHPDGVTIVGLLMHVPIAWLIATAHPWRAAVLLVVFGLFDTLDGELARLQNRASARGMVLDASTDRMKEVLLYAGMAYYFTHSGQAQWAVWTTLALGASLCVSYVKAKGEAAVAAAGAKLSHAELNKLFADGLLSFEVRMALLVVGLVFGVLAWVLVVIAVFSAGTAIMRLTRVIRKV